MLKTPSYNVAKRQRVLNLSSADVFQQRRKKRKSKDGGLSAKKEGEEKNGEKYILFTLTKLWPDLRA